MKDELLKAIKKLIEDSKYMRQEYSDMDEAVRQAEILLEAAED